MCFSPYFSEYSYIFDKHSLLLTVKDSNNLDFLPIINNTINQVFFPIKYMNECFSFAYFLIGTLQCHQNEEHHWDAVHQPPEEWKSQEEPKLRRQRELESVVSVHGKQLKEQRRHRKTQTIDVVKIGQDEQPPEQQSLNSRDELAVKINVSGNQSHAPYNGQSWKEKRSSMIQRKATMVIPYFTLDTWATFADSATLSNGPEKHQACVAPVAR